MEKTFEKKNKAVKARNGSYGTGDLERATTTSLFLLFSK